MTVQLNGAPEVYINFAAQIDNNTAQSLMALMADCANQNVQRVHLLMSTPGGSVMSGITAYNFLRSMPYELTTHNVGNVDSIGNAVFLAGRHRYTCANSTFMFHGVGFDIDGRFRLEEKLLRERLESIAADHKRIGAIMEDRTKLTKAAIAKLFLQAQTKDAAYAVGSGIVHEVRDVEIPAGVPVLSLVFQS